jgi:radical SAM superfamily enzyme YgiQ (UPF0313 family)
VLVSRATRATGGGPWQTSRSRFRKSSVDQAAEPQALVIIGGPQASVVDVATLRAFSCVDVVVRGEAEDIFPRLLELVEDRDARWEHLPGITFRRGFFGIETGSERLQHVINKKLDLTEALRRIECADRNGIHTTVALIVGVPEETRDDLRDTMLKEDGLIGLSASPLTWDQPAAQNPSSLAAAPHYSLPPQATHTQQPWPH